MWNTRENGTIKPWKVQGCGWTTRTTTTRGQKLSLHSSCFRFSFWVDYLRLASSTWQETLLSTLPEFYILQFLSLVMGKFMLSVWKVKITRGGLDCLIVEMLSIIRPISYVLGGGRGMGLNANMDISSEPLGLTGRRAFPKDCESSLLKELQWIDKTTVFHYMCSNNPHDIFSIL